MRPIWEALPGAAKGVWLTDFEPGILTRLEGPVLVASVGDARKAKLCGREVIYMEHGCGISYHGDDHAAQASSYAGGPGKEHAVLILTPGPYATAKQREAYPDIPVREIGCPKLDSYLFLDHNDHNDHKTVAVSFHWDCNVCPETRTAFYEYQSAVRRLKPEINAKILMHAHPRFQHVVSEFASEISLQFVSDFACVLERADLYVCDNSSTIYEFAAIDKPVVLLNASHYRRDIEHGLRFWEQTEVGVNCNTPEDLTASIEEALEDEEQRKRRRRKAVEAVYSHLDGRSTERAVQHILSVLG